MKKTFFHFLKDLYTDYCIYIISTFLSLPYISSHYPHPSQPHVFLLHSLSSIAWVYINFAMTTYRCVNSQPTGYIVKGNSELRPTKNHEII